MRELKKMADATAWRTLPEDHHIALNEAADILMFNCYQNSNPAKVGLAIYDALVMAYRVGRDELDLETMNKNLYRGDV